MNRTTPLMQGLGNFESEKVERKVANTQQKFLGRYVHDKANVNSKKNLILIVLLTSAEQCKIQCQNVASSCSGGGRIIRLPSKFTVYIIR